MTRKGFTLIELLVVIAIIAILAAILFPVFAKVREKARQTSCLSNEKQLALGLLQYTNDYDETYPCGASGFTNWNTQGWIFSVYPYIKSEQVLACPDDSSPTDNYNYKDILSYGLNSNYAYGIYGKNTAVTTKLAQFQSPAKTIEFFEVGGVSGNITLSEDSTIGGGSDYYYGGASGDGNCQPGYVGNAKSFSTPATPTVYETGLFANVTAAATGSHFSTDGGRHTNGSNYTFADGHAKWLRSSAVSAGYDNPTAGSPGTSGVEGSGCGGVSPYNNSFNGSIVAANTANSQYAGTFSFD
jgi:prepilin-type N-terminal cleavage/methylation domain-containing protein/prepilin-type processing-associated H-X9-DG protein